MQTEVAITMGSLLASLISLVKPYLDRRWANHFRECDADRETCSVALKRIQKEKPNFKHIVAKKPYKNPAHQKAVTESSFELLRKDVKELSELSGVWNYGIRCDARKLVHLVDQRDTAGVLAVIEQLEPRLKEKTRGIKVKVADAGHF